ncbi:MAG: c-type cytochrome [Thiotrichaceae bacterium]
MHTNKLNIHKHFGLLGRFGHLGIAIFAMGLLGATNLYAASSNVAWTSETRNLIKNANLENGAKIAKKCAKCHGADGTDMDVLEEEDTPYLAGQIAHANYKQIIDYQDKKRDDRTMFKKVKKLSRQDVADVSAFYATQALPLSSVKVSNVTPEATRMATRGAGERFIPPCAGCHGLKGEGSIVDVPALAGQSPSYFVTTMMAYKEGDRENDIYSRMRFIAERLSEKEITELADYYASIGTYNENAGMTSEEEEADSESDEPASPDAPDAPEAPAAPQN